MKKQYFLSTLCSYIKKHIFKVKEFSDIELKDIGIGEESKSEILVKIQMITETLNEDSALLITSSEDCYDYLYIDDDVWLRMIWEDIAKKSHYKLLVLSSTKDFCLHANKISKEETMIYLDSNLGDNEMRGEVFAEILHDAGYKNLYLATGHDPSNFAHLPWLTICGKDCPFEND